MFKVGNSPEMALKYHEEQQNVYKRFDIPVMVEREPKWLANPDVYMIMAFRNHNFEQPVAGMRIDLHRPSKYLSLIDALEHVSPEKALMLRAVIMSKEVAEACGWWASPKGSKFGVANLLMRAGIVLAQQLHIKLLLGFPNQYTRHVCEKFGYRTLNWIGQNGTVSYPDERYQSTAMFLEPLLLEKMHFNELNKIKLLKFGAIKNLSERYKNSFVHVNYQLGI